MYLTFRSPYINARSGADAPIHLSPPSGALFCLVSIPPGLTPGVVNDEAQDPGLTPGVVNDEAQDPGLTPGVVNDEAQDPGLTPGVVNDEAQDPGLTPGVVNDEAQDPGLTPRAIHLSRLRRFAAKNLRLCAVLPPVLCPSREAATDSDHPRWRSSNSIPCLESSIFNSSSNDRSR